MREAAMSPPGGEQAGSRLPPLDSSRGQERHVFTDERPVCSITFVKPCFVEEGRRRLRSVAQARDLHAALLMSDANDAPEDFPTADRRLATADRQVVGLPGR